MVSSRAGRCSLILGVSPDPPSCGPFGTQRWGDRTPENWALDSLKPARVRGDCTGVRCEVEAPLGLFVVVDFFP